jgi:hypothetical protein
MIFNPAHPGEVLKDYLGDMTVKEAAARLRDEGDVVPHIELSCGDHGGNVVEAVRGAGYVAGFLAEDAVAVRPVARPKENTEGAPVSARLESPTAAGIGCSLASCGKMRFQTFRG